MHDAYRSDYEVSKARQNTVPADRSRRKKTVVDHGQVPHLWFHKTQDAARNSTANFYFDGDTIYSYGSHFPIARHVTGAGGAAGVLFTTRTWPGNITSKHIHLTSRAIPDNIPVMHCERPDRKPSVIAAELALAVSKPLAALRAALTPPRKYPALKKATVKLARVDEPVTALAGKRLCINQSGAYWAVTHIRSGFAIEQHLSRAAAREMLHQLDHRTVWDKIPADGSMSQDVRELSYKLISAARKHVAGIDDVNRHPSAIAKLYLQLESAVNEANRFNQFFGYRARYEIPADFERARQITEQYQLEQRQRSAVRQARWYAENEEQRAEIMAEALMKDAEVIEKFRAGKAVYSSVRLRNLPVMLRIKGDEVETSMGATVPISHARRGLAFVRSVKASGQPYQRNGHTLHLGHYAIDRIDADGTLHAGCHHISYEEIERIAPLIGGNSPAIPGVIRDTMREIDFHEAEAILIRANRDAYGDTAACEILSRAKQYLTNQWDRQPIPYVRQAELAEAGKSTSGFDPEVK